ncbi:MAG TPA: hypothetical protein GX528_04160 [Firmicutes bacterium]|nr:hypothetical protein [Bacillota bacterium]
MISWREARVEFDKKWKKSGRGYQAEVGGYLMRANPVKLPVPPKTSFLAKLRYGMPKGWEWEFKDIELDVGFKGYALTLDDAVSDLKKHLAIFTK